MINLNQVKYLFNSIQVISLQPYLMLFPKYALFMDIIN
jgi:hypothetical protein